MARNVKNIFDNASRNIVRNFSNTYRTYSVTGGGDDDRSGGRYPREVEKEYEPQKKRSTRQKIADVLKGRDKDEGSILQAYKEMKQLSEVRKPFFGNKLVGLRTYRPGMARGPDKIEVQDPKTIRKRHNDRVKQFLYDRAMIGKA
jgi:hypothetical protein